MGKEKFSENFTFLLKVAKVATKKLRRTKTKKLRLRLRPKTKKLRLRCYSLFCMPAL